MSDGAQRPIIGIIPTFQTADSSLLLPKRYLSAIEAAGGAPIVLPLSQSEKTYEALLPLMDGFLLSGGQDISPERYGAQRTPEVSETTPGREEVEHLVLSYAYRYDVPLLGICRGMQMMNVFFGGTLYLDLEQQEPGENEASPHCSAMPCMHIMHQQTAPYSQPSHQVRIMAQSRLGHAVKAETLAVNSIHHQGICELAPNLEPAAFGPDNLTEAIEVAERTFMVGVQWHPEFLVNDNHMGLIFRELVEQARLYAQQRHAAPSVRIDRTESDGAWPIVEFADYI